MTSTAARGGPEAVPGSTADALAPLREHLTTAARARARTILGDAADSGRAALARARAEADDLLARARSDGEEEARDLLAAEAAAARGQARELVLRARRTAYEGLRARCEEAVGELLHDPDAHARLVSVVLDELGPAADITDLPDGGVLATSPDGRRVEASSAELVASALADVDLEGLWTHD